MKIPIIKPDFDNREAEAANSMLQPGWLVQGSLVTRFEQMIVNDRWNELRRSRVALYNRLLSQVDGIEPPYLIKILYLPATTTLSALRIPA